MTSRNIVIQRSSYGAYPSSLSSYGGGGSGGQRVSRTIERRYGASGLGGPGLPAGSYAHVTNSEMNSMRVTREKEKRDMQDLNERFASYIEKVRFLEAQNKKLADELEKLKANWGKETSAVKTMYQTELTEARRLLDDHERDRAKLEVRNAALEDQVAELRARLDEANRLGLADREKVEKQNQQLSDYEAEINLLRRRVEGFENDKERDRRQINHLTDSLNRARIDLDNETIQHIDAESRRQTLEDEIEFMRAVHEQEMKELAALVYRDTTTENREFWKNEMGQALREIQQVYDDKLDNMRGELESFYNLKIQEYRSETSKKPSADVERSREVTTRMKTQMTELYDKISDLDGKNQSLLRELDQMRRTRDEREREWETENNDLKVEVAKLRAELESILQELQSIMHAKLGLELEIAAYRKLLESEENRFCMVFCLYCMYTDDHPNDRQDGHRDRRTRGYEFGFLHKGEGTAKTSLQRSSKGPVNIGECDPDGRFIALENTGRKDESLGGWMLKRTVDGLDQPLFIFPDDYVIRAGDKTKVWSSGSRPVTLTYDDLVANVHRWEQGVDVVTKLLNTVGDDRATHVQKVTYV
ncbi:hypothetical protein HELRODRAFT_92478 [Helobdella robusta]|uniref:Intermediate filament protein n=1 Tax=Helobdella robusta TaxID=6412 RepID=T1G8H0_HELRO|nr:hypothetical protein HELRODRAFT_92478 [Helobdella robusta]ESO04825.1 hypothetical protein HELRODRAFT_92478 [Helobdella robusta]